MFGIRKIINRIKGRHYRAAYANTRTARSTEQGGVIRCHDCQKLGYIAFPDGPEPVLLTGWKLVWNGPKPLYICGECSAMRRRTFLSGMKPKI